MKANETLQLLEDKDFLDKIYNFSYHRCNTSFEAEDLCSDIILTVISAIHKQEQINNFYAFVWTIAHRVYADYCKKQNTECQMLSIEGCDLEPVSKNNEIDVLIEDIVDQEHLRKIFKEISFLSKAYREVMIMYYIDELKVTDIAKKLNINETTIKQRLFSARNSIKKEVETMNERNLLLKPVKLAISGTGNPCGNDPRTKTERIFSQNLIYLCKDKPKTAKELSEELCIPMPYIEEELEIQCRGENGKYGMLRKLENGKYAVNIHLVDYDEYDRANKIYEKYLPEFCEVIKNTLNKNAEKILAIPYLSEQKDTSFIMWSLISMIVWKFQDKVNNVLAERFFSDLTPIKRDFSVVAVAYTDEQPYDFDFYGCDGINANSVGGYKSVFASNIYGKRIDAHFHCAHNISNDKKLLMVLKSIGGISLDELSESEKEIAAKAIECGYLRKNKNIIEPKIIILEKKHEKEFYNFAIDFNADMENIIEQIASEIAAFIRKNIPEHLINEYQIYTELIAGNRILSKAIDECINTGLLSKPESRLGAEGMLMVVEK